MKKEFLSLEEWNYEIDKEKIAVFPVRPRHNSKLLIYRKGGAIQQDIFLNIASYLPSKSLLVFNNTKTIPARLFFFDNDKQIEFFCLSPYLFDSFEAVFEAEKSVLLCVAVGNFKKWKTPILTRMVEIGNELICVQLSLVKNNLSHQPLVVKIHWDKEGIRFKQILNSMGVLPIPPYLKRETQESDKDQYQTIFGIRDGSVATPTAGLHFTEDVFQSLNKQGIQRSFLTLHVGADTFKPIQEKNIYDHQMHGEVFFVSTTLLKLLLQNQENIFAVGTTSLRSLESIYWIGIKIYLHKQISLFETVELKQDFIQNHWDCSLSFQESIACLLQIMEQQGVYEIRCSTTMMITPSYTIKSIDGLITNFHQPKSTLLLMIESVVGDAWKDIYDYALKNNFRFFSFGDACLLLTPRTK